MAKLTEQEMIAKYDSERSGAAWLKIQEITDDPTNDGGADVWKEIIDILTNDEDDGSDIPLSADEEKCLDILLKKDDGSDRAPFGQLADGTPMVGTSFAGKRSGCVTINTPAMMLTADCDGFVSGENRRGDEWSINFDGASLEEIQALRAFLNSGAVERMLAAAVAWENGDSAPPTF